MNDDISHLVYQGAVAVREGRRGDAQGLLFQAIERDERNELAWLWMSGAVDDPADQQVALENVLAINPDNQAAKEGLDWLRSLSTLVSKPPPQQPSGPWVPPPPLREDEALELTCWRCQATLYRVAQFCWQCHASVHVCKNCTFLPDPRCKEIQGLTNPLSQETANNCPWWRPSQ